METKKERLKKRSLKELTISNWYVCTYAQIIPRGKITVRRRTWLLDNVSPSLLAGRWLTGGQSSFSPNERSLLLSVFRSLVLAV